MRSLPSFLPLGSELWSWTHFYCIIHTRYYTRQSSLWTISDHQLSHSHPLIPHSHPPPHARVPAPCSHWSSTWALFRFQLTPAHWKWGNRAPAQQPCCCTLWCSGWSYGRWASSPHRVWAYATGHTQTCPFRQRQTESPCLTTGQHQSSALLALSPACIKHWWQVSKGW